MNMTREEAKQILSDWNLCHYTPSKEAAEAVISAIDPLEIISALSGPTREMVERMRGEWIDKPTGRYGQRQAWCKACGKHSGIGGIKSNQHKPFCPNCGAPMTDEAVNMMLRRWKEAVE